YAREQVRIYAKTECQLFGLMIAEGEAAFRQKIYAAKAFVFGDRDTPLLLSSEIMDEFSMADREHHRKPNSHLSILSMVCTWHTLNINPYDNLICQTPPFRLRLGIAEFLFKDEE